MMKFLTVRSIRAALRALVAQPDRPVIIDLTDHRRKREIREREYQQALDEQSRIMRTSERCRTAERRSVTAIVERGKP